MINFRGGGRKWIFLFGIGDSEIRVGGGTCGSDTQRCCHLAIFPSKADTFPWGLTLPKHSAALHGRRGTRGGGWGTVRETQKEAWWGAVRVEGGDALRANVERHIHYVDHST
jgi:hypothetical protein